MTTTNRKLLIAANRPVDILRKFTFDTTGGKAGISTCNAFIKRIKGSTIVWNQQIYNGNFSDSTTGWNILYADNVSISQNVISLYNSATDTAVALYPTRFVNTQGHIYFAKFRYKFAAEIGTNIAANILGVSTNLTANGKWQTYNYIGTLGQAAYYVRPTTLTGVLLQFSDFTVFDFTLMFGAGNEPATVAEFEALFPPDYYDYNAGQLLSFTGDDIKTTGFNQWDEQWEIGDIDANTGANIAGTSCWRTKNYIPILPNTYYYIYFANTGNSGFRARFYDADKHYIGYNAQDIWPVSNRTFLTPVNAYYIRFSPEISLFPTGTQVCLNISHNGTKNGTYEEYEQHIKDISFYKSIKDGQGNTLFPYGLLSAGSVYDEVTATKAIKRIGAVDMGSLGWGGAAIDNIYRFTSAAISTKKEGQLNVICSKYEVNSLAISRGKEDTICGNAYNQSIYVTDSTYTSWADFTAAMQGVMLYYELAEPIEVPLSDIDLTYYANKWGTEHLLPDNTSVPTTTFALFDVRYKVGTPRT